MATKAPSTSKSKRSLTKTAKEVVERFQASWDYQSQNHHKRWERNYKLYNGKRTDPGYKGTSNTFVPIVYPSVETATANLCSGRPSIDFMPQDMYKYIQSYYENGTKPDLKALNAQFDYYWDCDNWDLKTIKLVRTGFLYGTGVEWVFWDNDKPRILSMNPRDAIIDPSLSDPMQLITNPDDFFSGRRFITTLDALREEKVVDPKTGELKPRYKNLDKVQPGYIASDQTDKELKEAFLGTTGTTDDKVEVAEIWDGQRIRSVANRVVNIEDRPNELGIHCLVIHRFIADESVVYGKALVDPIAAQQEALNDTTNQSIDAVTDQLNPQWELDPAYADQIPKITNAPGTVYPFTPGTLRQIVKQPVSPQAFNERQNMKNEMQEAIGIDKVVNGVGDDTNATATEINAQINQAGARFTIYVRMLEREGLYQRAKIVYKMMLHYVTDTQLVPTNTMDGPKFYPFRPNQFDETYEPKIQLEATVKGMKGQDAEKAMQAYQALIADPSNDLYETKKILYPKMFDLSEEELDRIVGQQKPPALGGPEMGMPGEAGPEVPGALPEEPVAPVEAPVEPDVDAEGNARLQAALAQLGAA